MKNILFRGKTKEGKWVYGYLFIQGEGTEYEETYIFGGLDYRESIYDVWKCAEKVDPKTVGQWTGFNDKNGKMIFEGDIIRTRKKSIRTEKLKGYYGFDSDGYPQKIPGYEGEYEYHYSCKVDYYAPVEFSQHSGYHLRGTSTFIDAICNEVVGNIHDNPELLEEK